MSIKTSCCFRKEKFEKAKKKFNQCHLNIKKEQEYTVHKRVPMLHLVLIYGVKQNSNTPESQGQILHKKAPI